MEDNRENNLGQAAPSPRRRRFLIGAGALAFLGAALSYPVLRRDDAGFIGARLHELLPDLRIDPDELDAFAGDFVSYYRNRNPLPRNVFLWGARTLWTYLPGGDRKLLSSAASAPHHRFELELIANFLMGTDYLEVRQDPDEQVTYIAMPDPYEMGCANVFARYD